MDWGFDIISQAGKLMTPFNQPGPASLNKKNDSFESFQPPTIGTVHFIFLLKCETKSYYFRIPILTTLNNKQTKLQIHIGTYISQK